MAVASLHLMDSAQPCVVCEPVELWSLRVSDSSPVSVAGLSEAEQEHARRLREPADRERFLASHLLLRELLGVRLGLAPRQLLFRRATCPACGDQHGRPVLAWPAADVHFSLSRRGDIVLVAIAETAVGVDVELVPSEEASRQVSRLLPASERDELERAASAQRPEVFARLWARKEAYLKGVGTGVGCGLAGPACGLADPTGTPSPQRGWRVFDVATKPGYAAAAAVQERAD